MYTSEKKPENKQTEMYGCFCETQILCTKDGKLINIPYFKYYYVLSTLHAEIRIKQHTSITSYCI